MMIKIAFKFKESILILIRSINICKSVEIYFLNSTIWICQPPPPRVILLCSSENWNFGRKYWSLGDDLVQLSHIAFNCFNLVGYGL